MRLSGKRVRVVRRTLADGSVKEYRYEPKAPKSKFAPDSVQELIQAYKRSPEWAKLSPSTKENKGYYFRDLEELADWRVADVKRRTLLAMRDAIAGERGNGAANVFIRVASALFAWAVDRQWEIETNPAQRIRQLEGGHLVAWTAEQAQEACAKLPEHLRRVVVMALYTGQRRGDLIAMTWRAYDGATIKVRQQKTGAELVIPVHPTLKVELDEWRRSAASTHILVSGTGQPWEADYLSHAMPDALAKIGLSGLNVHGLRKLAAASLAEAGCSVHEIAAITGHKSLAMVALYTASASQKQLAGAAIIRWQNVTENAGKTGSKSLKDKA